MKAWVGGWLSGGYEDDPEVFVIEVIFTDKVNAEVWLEAMSQGTDRFLDRELQEYPLNPEPQVESVRKDNR